MKNKQKQQHNNIIINTFIKTISYILKNYFGNETKLKLRNVAIASRI